MTVEGGIQRRDAVGGRGRAAEAGDFLGRPLLDFDAVAVGKAEVNGAGGGGDVEGDAVFPGQNRQRVGAYLVGGVAVGGDAVRPR